MANPHVGLQHSLLLFRELLVASWLYSLNFSQKLASHGNYILLNEE